MPSFAKPQNFPPKQLMSSIPSLCVATVSEKYRRKQQKCKDGILMAKKSLVEFVSPLPQQKTFFDDLYSLRPDIIVVL